MRRMLAAAVVWLAAAGAAHAGAGCAGSFLNPIAEVNWSALFPLKIGGVTVAGGSLPDAPGGATSAVCWCPIPTPPFIRVGVATGYWDPARTAEVVREPFCFPVLGGMQLSIGGVLPHGARMAREEGGARMSFYHVHWLATPLLYVMNLIKSAACVQPESFDIVYVTELDPLWDDDELAFVLNPEAALFGTAVAQAACAADCVTATAGLPLDALFWCAGCQGGLYPFTGTVADHTGGVRASLLLVERMIAKLHREGLLPNTSDKAAQCLPIPALIVKKSQYRMQLMRPVRQTKLPALPFGRTTTLVDAGKEFPVAGEDFVWLVWRKRECCAF